MEIEKVVNDKKEAVWFAVISVIALLVLVILNLSGNIIEAQMTNAGESVPGFYWALVLVCLGLCALVPYLLKNSKPLSFKIIATVLTSAAPAAVICFVLFSLWRASGS